MYDSHRSPDGLDSRSNSADQALRLPGNRTRTAVLAAATAAVAIIAVTIGAHFTWFDDRPRPDDEATASAVAPSGAEARASGASDGRSTAAPVDAAHGTADGEHVAAEARARAERDALFARYRTEPVDARWAAAKEATLLEASTSAQIVALDAQPRDLGVDCKSSICRVYADFDRQSTAQDWLTMFLLNAGSEMPNAVFRHSMNADRSARLEVFGYSRSPLPSRSPPPRDLIP